MAQRINKIGADSYVIKVDSGGSIELDVGPAGAVTVTGDLAVQGESTSIGSSDLVVEDNTITVNAGETGSGVTLNTAGLIVERGIANDAYFFWDERINSISGGIARQGSWILQDSTNAVNGLVASSIRPDIIGVNNLTLLAEGTGIVTVTGTTDYEKQVYPYDGDSIQTNPSTPTKLALPNDDDALVNARVLEDFVKGYTTENLQTGISKGDTTPTSVKTFDFEVDSSTSRIEFKIDDSLLATMFENRLEIGNIKITQNSITSSDVNGDVVIAGAGTGGVRLDTATTIKKLDDPVVPSDGVSLYSKPLADGGTGIFFVNEDTTQDELASRNKALLFGETKKVASRRAEVLLLDFKTSKVRLPSRRNASLQKYSSG